MQKNTFTNTQDVRILKKVSTNNFMVCIVKSDRTLVMSVKELMGYNVLNHEMVK